MQINQVCKLTGLTKKAVEYYLTRGLLAPDVLENGYRDYREEDAAVLQKISVLRKLSLSVEEIKTILEEEPNGAALHKILIQKEINLQMETVKKELLAKLSGGQDYEQIGRELQSLEKNKTISEKLLEAFPGYYGRFVCLHFTRFLNEPIQTKSQQSAYEAMIEFLDQMPPLALSVEVQEYLEENTNHIESGKITEMENQVRHSAENPEEFLEEKHDFIEWYLAYKQSEEYKNSLACKLKEQLKAFNESSGYNEVFIPLLRKISSSYDAYSKTLEAANDIFVSRYPEMQGS